MIPHHPAAGSAVTFRGFGRHLGDGLAFSRSDLNPRQRHAHQFDLLLVLRESRGSISWTPETAAASHIAKARGQVIVWPAHVSAALTFGGQVRVDAIALTAMAFRESAAQPQRSRVLLPQIVEDRLIDHLASACYELSEAGRSSGPDVAAQLGRALSRHLVDEYSTAATPESGGAISPQELQAIHQFVQGHLAESLSVSQLAEYAGMSESHFSRSFRAVTGSSPLQFVIRCRLNHVKKLIEEGVSLSGAALESGFSSQSHMHRHFRRVFGMTPGAFQRASAR